MAAMMRLYFTSGSFKLRPSPLPGAAAVPPLFTRSNLAFLDDEEDEEEEEGGVDDEEQLRCNMHRLLLLLLLMMLTLLLLLLLEQTFRNPSPITRVAFLLPPGRNRNIFSCFNFTKKVETDGQQKDSSDRLGVRLSS